LEIKGIRNAEEIEKKRKKNQNDEIMWVLWRGGGVCVGVGV